MLRNQKLLILFLFIFFPIICWIYYQRVGTFSLGDEWNNWVPAFFMQKGRTLFSQVFHNHQLLPVYISFILQSLFHPTTLYKLVFLHRGFVIAWSILFNLLIIYRFGLRGAGFVFVYELTKYYVFGNLFLAETLLVYPLVYLFGQTFEKLKGIKLTKIELILSSICAWFIIFAREPFMPIAIILYSFLLWETKRSRQLLVSIWLFVILCSITLISTGRGFLEYIDQVFIYNLTVVLPGQTETSLLKSFFYPIFIFFEGKWNHFREVQVYASVVFLIYFSYLVFKLKQYKNAMLLIFFLGLANIRTVAPGTAFFEAFHIAPWYGMFVFSIFSLATQVYIKAKKNLVRVATAALFVGFALSILSPKSYIWEKVDRDREFTINYSAYFIQGEVIRILANKNDTLFTDLWDYLIHFQANLDSSYKWAIYIFSMRGSPKYEGERNKMFIKNPPDFYYTYCPKGVYRSDLLPAFIQGAYIQLYRKDKPSCIYIKKTKVKTITPKQLKNIGQHEYSLIQ